MDQLGRFRPDASDTIKCLRRSRLRELAAYPLKAAWQIDGVHEGTAKPPMTNFSRWRTDNPLCSVNDKAKVG